MEYLKTGYPEFKTYRDATLSPIDFIESDQYYFLYLSNGGFKIETSVKKNDPVIEGSDQQHFESNYKTLPSTNSSTNAPVEVRSQAPFAKPDFRTKKNATSDWVSCPASADTPVDFKLLAKHYVSGGEIIFKNAKKGDWVCASVHDVDGVIPEPYRAALCENWPLVAKYIIKKWLVPTDVDGYGFLKINTYPLNAKITAGLYLRVKYHASSEAGTRECAVNYDLAVKL